MAGHYATYECIVHGFGSVNELRSLRRRQPHVSVPTVGPKLAMYDMWLFLHPLHCFALF